VNPAARRQLIIFVFGAFAISWGAELPMILAPRVIPITSLRGLELLFIASISPSLMALILTGAHDGFRGLRRLLGGVVRWRARPVYYTLALALPTGLSLLAQMAPSLWGGVSPALFVPSANPWSSTVSPSGEELGWRGYALPRLQPRFQALGASLLLGAVWALWHAPQWLIPGARITLFPIFFTRILAESVFLTWLYNNTRRSLLIVILAHTGMNLSIVRLIPIHGSDVTVQALYMLFFCAVAAWIVWQTRPATLTNNRHAPLSLVVDGAVGADHAEREAYPA
jgi:membrane protease YdiL (CAAX protease family)